MNINFFAFYLTILTVFLTIASIYPTILRKKFISCNSDFYFLILS